MSGRGSDSTSSPASGPSGGGTSPLVSVIVPTFNSHRTLRAALASVLRQDLADVEVLVAGDGCTDDSAAVATSFADPRVQWINLPGNSGGPCRPRNEALGRARGQYIAYLGHDDLWLPWHLSTLVAAIEESGAALVSSLGVYLEPRGASTAFGFPEGPRTHAPLSPSTWLHRSDLDLHWPEHLRWGHEVFVADRLLARGVACRQVGEVTAIKFPAPSWRAYAADAPLPQLEALAAIGEAARAFQGRLLSQLAVAVSGALVLSGRSRHSLLARAAVATLVRWLRPYRWPLDRLLLRRHRRASGLSARHPSDRGPTARESTGT